MGRLMEILFQHANALANRLLRRHVRHFKCRGAFGFVINVGPPLSLHEQRALVVAVGMGNLAVVARGRQTGIAKLLHCHSIPLNADLYRRSFPRAQLASLASVTHHSIFTARH